MRNRRVGVLERASQFLSRRFARVREVNRKYRTPHVKMTPGVRIALLLLRLYLLLLVGLLFFKFFTLVVGE